MKRDNVQWVCTREPACLCQEDGNPYSCACHVLHEEGAVRGFCLRCLAPMNLIDMDTGDLVVETLP